MTTEIKKQFDTLKKKHPDTLLLFRCGDFYETYNEDATTAAYVLGITNTKRGETNMAGFPHHALDTYLPRLIRAGQRVAICDQLDAPKPLVKRGTPQPKKVQLPSLTKEQYELLCECIRYRAADNDKERQVAGNRGISTAWYDNYESQLDELKAILYNLK